MKKTAIILCVILMLCTLFSCGEKTLLSPDDPVTLSFWHVYGEQAESPMNRLVNEFNTTVGREKGIVVKVTNVTGTSKISSQLEASFASKPGSLEKPDIFSCHTNTAVTVGPENLVDMNNYFTEDDLSSFVTAFISEGTIDDRLVVFPVSKSTYTLYVNNTQFEKFSRETGVTYSDLATWDGFLECAEKYYRYSGGKCFCALDYLIRHVELDVLSEGGNLSYTQDGWYDTDEPHLKESWEKFASALVQGHIAVSDLYANTQIMTGEVIAGIGSSAAIIYFNDTVTYADNTTEALDLKVLPLPQTEGKEKYMPQTGVGLAAYYTDDKKAEAAYEFIKWFTQGERNLDFVAGTGYMPVQDGAYDAIDSYEFINDSYRSLYEAIRTMKESCTPVVRPSFDGYYDKTDMLYKYLRTNRETFVHRCNDGEPVSGLVDETWQFFCDIK